MKFSTAAATVAGVVVALAMPTTVQGAPTMVDPDTPGKVVGGVLAHLASLPIAGPFWLNAAISGNRPTNLESTPPQFTPVAVASMKDVWGAAAVDIPIKIS